MSLEDVARSLKRLEGPGGFAMQHREPAMGLGFAANGVGWCEFPLADNRVRALLEHAVPSPFGYRDETRRDASVRDSWEIPGSELQVDALTSSPRFVRALDQIVGGLGFSPDVAVTPVLHKLLIYGPGQFFARHRDSQKTPGTAGTLVVVLPTSHRGGDVVVSHAGRHVTLSTAKDSSSDYLSFLGFYADCLHETRPVEQGYRVALTYALEAESSSLTPFDDGADLRRSLQRFFSEQPWLVYLLDHQYSEQSMDWSRLKNADRVRAAAFLEAAKKLDCACFLALADVREAYEFTGDEDDDDAGGVDESDEVDDHVPPSPAPDRHDDLGDDELELPIEDEASSESELGVGGPPLERELTLSHWVDDRGQPCRGSDEYADDSCILTTSESIGQSPYATSAEPWTGNEGGTAEKWYHHTALVVLPRGSDLHFEVTDSEVTEPQSTNLPPATGPSVVRRPKRTKL